MRRAGLSVLGAVVPAGPTVLATGELAAIGPVPGAGWPATRPPRLVRILAAAAGAPLGLGPYESLLRRPARGGAQHAAARRPSAVPIDSIVPAQPIRGPAAAGHSTRIAAGWRGDPR